MDDYFMVRRHVPAFGSWDSAEYFSFTECFESPRPGGLLRYTYHEDNENAGSASGGGHLCITGDLYQNDVVTPAVILVPGSQSKFLRPAMDTKETMMKKQRKWERGLSVYAHKQNGQHQPKVPSSRVRLAKPVDEDLYKISPDQLHNNVKKKKGSGCCFLPSCFK